MPHQAKMLEALIENARDYAIVMMDIDGCILLWNRGAENILGWQETEIVGQHASLFFTPEDQAQGGFEREMRIAREQGRAADERWHLRKDGSRFWGSGTVFPVTEGELRGYIKIFRDLTAQKRAEKAMRQSEKKYSLLVASVDQGFCHCQIILDAEGRAVDYLFLEVNPAFEKMTGLQGAEGRTIRQLVPDIEEWWMQTYEKVVSTGEPVRFQQGSMAMGRVFDAHATRVGPGRFAVLFTDITAKKRAEQEREQYIAEIESLNVRLARAMQETHHRVKNNLQVIAALVEVQADELGAGAAVQRIKQHVSALASIHDLLTRQAKVDITTSIVSAKTVLQHLIPILEVTSGERRIKADIADVMLPVQQATSLSLLVSECVSNAVKHAHGGVEITLTVADGIARLEICDDGPGFPPDFDPRQAANTGLELIESTARWDLRGELSYENCDQGGGRVVVTFPLDTLSRKMEKNEGLPMGQTEP